MLLLYISQQNVVHVYKRTMVGRIRDFHGRVINPKDHFVLPNKQKLSRSDVRDILSDPSVWRGNIQSLIPHWSFQMHTWEQSLGLRVCPNAW